MHAKIWTDNTLTSPLTVSDGQQGDACYAGRQLELLGEEVERGHKEVVGLHGRGEKCRVVKMPEAVRSVFKKGEFLHAYSSHCLSWDMNFVALTAVKLTVVARREMRYRSQRANRTKPRGCGETKLEYQPTKPSYISRGYLGT